MTRTTIEGAEISKSFGGLRVLAGVGFRVSEGEIVALIGPNGAGKTTLFNLISGLMRLSAGSIRMGSHELTSLPAHRILLVKFRYYYMLGLGLTLIVIVLLLPSGLAGLGRRSRPVR